MVYHRNITVEFSPELQRYSRWISSLNSAVLLLLGICFLATPAWLVELLLDYSDDSSHSYNEEVVGSLTRMAGGVVLAQGLACLILVLPLFHDLTGSSDNSLEASNRTAIAIQSITGLCWVVVGLIDDRTSEAWGGHRRRTFGLLVVGFAILMLSCAALMMSFWPVVHEEEEEIETSRNMRVHNSLAEPLLGDDSNARQESNAAEENFDILEDGPSQEDQVSESASANEIESQSTAGGDHEDASEAPESSSRIRGTRRLLKLAAPQVRYLYIGCLTLLVRLPFSLSIPHFVSTTLGAVSEGDFDRARREILWLFLLGTIDACLDFWCIFWFGYADLRIVRGVRLDTFAAILRQEIAFFDVHTSGELASRLNSDCGEMAGDLTWFFRFSIESVVRITGITTYMLIRSPKLAACALGIVPIVAAVNKSYGLWLSENSRKVQDALAAANSIAQESLSCVRTVIAFASEQLECDKYLEKINVQYELSVKQIYMTGIYYMFVSTFLINTVVQGSLLLIGSFMIQHGNLTGEVLLAFMLYQGQLQNEMMNLFQSYSSLIKSSGAGDKVFALLDRSPPSPATGSQAVQENLTTRPVENEDGHSLPSSSLSVQLKEVHFRYPSRPDHSVLSGLNLEIPAGKTVALVGPSGCGKSTIVGLLQRFYDPTEGTVLVNGQDLQSLNLKAHRNQIGVVTQDPTLFSGTILSNIRYGTPDATSDQAEAAARKANAHGFISEFPDGYETQVGERGVQLSGGQKQRLAISRAIVRNPSLLLLDEATSALDAESEEVVQAALDEVLRENEGVTTVIIAHRLRTVRNADVIAVVNSGRIVELGSHEELLQADVSSSTGYYRKMVEKSLGGNLALDS